MVISVLSHTMRNVFIVGHSVSRGRSCFLPDITEKNLSLFLQDILAKVDFSAQVDHLFSTNCFSKQAINHADFFTLKIWTQSDPWHITSVLAAIGVIYCSEEKQKQL